MPTGRVKPFRRPPCVDKSSGTAHRSMILCSNRRERTAMYLPAHFRVDDVTVLTDFIRAHPLALLVTLADGTPTVDHVPVEVSTEGDRLILRGHVARANPIVRHMVDGSRALAVFRGQEHYVSPSWYATKPLTGKVVPTWNYNAVHVSGVWHWHRDPSDLLDIVTRLTNGHETPRHHPWRVGDAPDDYIQGMLAAIVGFTIEVSEIVGKFKASQNRVVEDREGVRRGLAEAGLPGSTIDALVREPGT
jgi:transcriptional regulator